MRATTAFSRLLSLHEMRLGAVRFEDRRVIATVALRRRHSQCPDCAYRAKGRFDTRPVHSVWRHLDLGVWRLEVHAQLRRLWCSCHRAKTEAVSFARSGSGFTRDFESVGSWLATHTDKRTITRLVRIDWPTVRRIIERVTLDELDRDRLDDLFEIGIDEVSWASQHRYLTLVTDHRRRKIVWGATGADRKTADCFLTELGEHRAHQIQAISLDMGPGYAKSARANAPQAVIAIDPSHVAQADLTHSTRCAAAVETSCARPATRTPHAASRAPYLLAGRGC